jgi:hypothetical protein
MDEPEREDPQQPGTGPPADPAVADSDPAEAAIPPSGRHTRAHRLRGALVSRAAGWVVAVALAGAVAALSAVLATTPRGLQVQALAGPEAFTAIPAPGAVTGPGQVQIPAVPVPRLRALCAASPGRPSIRVALPVARGARPPAKAIVIKPGATRLLPIVVCPLG